MRIVHGIFKKDLIDLVVFVSVNKNTLIKRKMRETLSQGLPLLVEIVSISELIKTIENILGLKSLCFDPAIFKYCLMYRWFLYDVIKEGT